MFDSIRLRTCLLALAVGLLVPHASTAQSCPLVVDPNGGGHFTDLQPALDHFEASLGNLGPCTIELRPGSYLNAASLDGVNAGASSDAQRLVIRGTRTPGGGWASVFNTGRRDALRLRSSRYVTLRDLQVLTGTNKPIAIEGGSAANRSVTVDSNDLHDNGGGRDSGCVFVGDSNVDTWIVNNVCWNNGSDGITLGKGGPSYVVNNTLFMNRKSGIVVAKGASAVLANNLVAFHTLSGIVLGTSGAARTAIGDCSTTSCMGTRRETSSGRARRLRTPATGPRPRSVRACWRRTSSRTLARGTSGSRAPRRR
jgi:hypothetical protein